MQKSIFLCLRSDNRQLRLTHKKCKFCVFLVDEWEVFGYNESNAYKTRLRREE